VRNNNKITPLAVGRKLMAKGVFVVLINRILIYSMILMHDYKFIDVQMRKVKLICILKRESAYAIMPVGKR